MTVQFRQPMPTGRPMPKAHPPWPLLLPRSRQQPTDQTTTTQPLHPHSICHRLLRSALRIIVALYCATGAHLGPANNNTGERRSVGLAAVRSATANNQPIRSCMLLPLRSASSLPPSSPLPPSICHHRSFRVTASSITNNQLELHHHHCCRSHGHPNRQSGPTHLRHHPLHP